MAKEYKIQEDSVGFHVGYTARVMKNALARNFISHGYSITPEQWHVLMLLWMKDGRKQSGIIEHSNRDKTSVARLLSGMEERNLIVRIPDERDKRTKLIYLTNKGKKLKEKLMSVASATIDHALHDFSQNEVEELKSMLTRMRDNLDIFFESNVADTTNK